MSKKLISFVASLSLLTSACTTTNPMVTDFAPSENAEESAQLPVVRDPAGVAAEQIFNHSAEKISQLDWYDLFAELTALNQMKMTADRESFRRQLYNSTYYAASGFNGAYSRIAQAKTTKEAFRTRESVMSVGDSAITKISSFAQLKKAATLGDPAFITKVLEQAPASRTNAAYKLTENNNYFNSDVGRDATNILSDYVLVVVPGFGSHTIKDYTWPEIVRHANLKYGRPAVRPLVGNEYQRIETFYGRNQSVGFDVVHPMGYELGFSMGSDAESGNALASWLDRLQKLPAYTNKKFILLGYSKGTPISINAFVAHPQLARKIAAIVTMAGVSQGSVPANSFVKFAYEQTGATSKQDLINKLTERLQAAENRVTSARNLMSGALVASGANEQYLNQAGTLVRTLVATGSVMGNVEDTASPADRRKIIEGIVDMSNYEAVQWSLKNYNNQKFQSPVSIFNMSMVTNVKDFVRPDANNATLTPGTIVPQFATDSLIQYDKFSKDNVFLYLTSLSGFEESAFGLFDTQVAWGDTKSLAIDSRPLSQSLAPVQLDMMKRRLASEGVTLPANFASQPRKNLLQTIAAQRGGATNINYVSIADHRGTHWDPAFEQVYKPELSNTQNYYKHKYPRRALQASIIEMLAIYKQLGGM